jgi:4-diphosphocytidyl-2-C-methyl-D-erythritol kinase
MAVLRETARAKVNLTLHVRGRRADGYHDLESLVAFAECADGVSLVPGERPSLKVNGPRAAECGSLDDNLVLKAARLLAERAPKLSSGAFELDKHLPAAAGIGGGSADAAAALRLLARANDIGRDDPRVVEAARATGADVPVCLHSVACVMSGVGEAIAPLKMPRLPCVLVNPGVPVATKDVFAALGLKPGERAPGAHAAIVWPGSSASTDQWLSAICGGRNDLEPPALRLQPVIGDVLGALAKADGCVLARMSGSGATCFGLFRDDVAAELAARRFAADRPHWWVAASALG